MNRIDELERRLKRASELWQAGEKTVAFIELHSGNEQAIALCRELAAGQQWRDMSNAPKDGTQCLFRGHSGYKTYETTYQSGHWREGYRDDWLDESNTCFRDSGFVPEYYILVSELPSIPTEEAPDEQ